MGMMLFITVYGLVFLTLTSELMADENVTLHGCSPLNFLNATVFRANRNLVLESLRKNISTNRFGTDLQDNGSDAVYGLAQCRADLPLSHCTQCFEKAEEQLDLLCPTQNGGQLFVDGCFLRYENSTFFNQALDTGNSNCSSSSNSTAVKFSDTTEKLLRGTVAKALTNNSFAIAWTVESDSSTNIYALAQCWPSLTTQNCQTCLQQAQNLMQNCLPSTEGQVLVAGCYLRYATNPFFSVNGIAATNFSGGSKSKTVGIILGVIGAAVLVIAAAFFVWSRLRKRNKWHKRARPGGLELGGKSVWFDYEELREATGNFNSRDKIGEGGFGEVYKGTLRDGREIAVKRLFASESSAEITEFSTEMELISSVSHRNLVTVLGCCTLQNQRFLVFEYMANRSLDGHLFGKEGICLSWEERFNIIFGTARGLAYLHEHSHVRIVHRDIKAANILLDGKFQPKIADFGLARLFPHDRTHLTTTAGGTLGYTAPEYAVHGQLTEKADVYSFGVVVLEIVSGRKCIQTNLPADMQLLPRLAWRLYLGNEGLGIVDPRLEGVFDAEQVLRVINISLLCVHDSPTKRPSMSNVVSMLASHSPMLRDAAQEKPAFMKKVDNMQYLFTPSTSQSSFSSTAGPSNSSASMSQPTFSTAGPSNYSASMSHSTSSTAGPPNSSASISNTL